MNGGQIAGPRKECCARQGLGAKEWTMLEISRRQLIAGTAAIAALPWGASYAQVALGPKPSPLPQPVKLTVGLAKVVHLAPDGFMGP